MITPLLIGNRAGVLNGIDKSHDKKIYDYLIKNNKQLNELTKQINKESNQFKHVDLNKERKNLLDKILGREQRTTIIDRFTRFLNMLKTKSHKRVLVVSHGSVLNLMPRLIMGIALSSNIHIVPDAIEYNNLTTINYDKQNSLVKLKKYHRGTCGIMGFKYIDGKFIMYISPNSLHLKHLIDN